MKTETKWLLGCYGIPLGVFAVLLVLKLYVLTRLSWWLVTAPLWAPMTMLVLGVIAILIWYKYHNPVN